MAGLMAAPKGSSERQRRKVDTMAEKQQLHPDLAALEGLRPGGLRLSPQVLGIANSIGAISMVLHRPSKDIQRSRHRIHTPGGMADVTIYEPAGLAAGAPCLVYLHGGGFVLGDFPYSHDFAISYARALPCKVLFVRYRLAPKQPFPQGLEDCYASLVWARDHAAGLGIDATRMAVGGDSAGGCLAAALCLLSRDRGGPAIRFQMLIYPVTDRRLSTPSMKEFDNTPIWNSRLSSQMWAHYLRDGDQCLPGYASPMEAESLEGLPPAYVEIEEFDCLRDEGRAYAQRLAASGVEVELNEIQGSCHGFDVLSKAGIAREAMERRYAALRAHLL
ncbi:MAG: alpha/beta hydrolase [Spirochaetota bacterium]